MYLADWKDSKEIDQKEVQYLKIPAEGIHIARIVDGQVVRGLNVLSAIIRSV